MAQGMLLAAEESADQLVRGQPGRVEPLVLLATINEKLGNHAGAAQLLRQALLLRTTDLNLLMALTMALHRQAKADEAIKVCDEALAIQSDSLAFIVQKSSSLVQANRYGDAWIVLEPQVSKTPLVPAVAIAALRVLFGLKRLDEAIKVGVRAMAEPEVNDEDRRAIYLHLVKIFDKSGRYDEAMHACNAAHAMSRRRFDPQHYVAYVDSLIRVFAPGNLRILARANNTSEKPAFVIGMPRSGTTLVEQIITAHPQAFGAGEINDIVQTARAMTGDTGSMHVYPDSLTDVTSEVATRWADQYLARLQVLAGDALRVTNKMLEQYEHVGLIWMLLPKARIIHVRRNPLDTCLSCFTRHLNPQRMPYVTDLEHLGLVYRQHERLMEHWRSALDLSFLTVQYEDLVSDQERLTRQIIDFLGLPWDDRCLRYWEADRTVMTLSYDQVNKPIYDSSIGRWKNYERHLGPLRKALEITGDDEGFGAKSA